MSHSKSEAVKDKARQEVTKLVAKYQGLPAPSINRFWIDSNLWLHSLSD